MACFINPEEIEASEYVGIDLIFEYTNGDGQHVRTNCGQAAAATMLTYHGKLPPDEHLARDILADLERRRPPDNLGGIFGTSQRQVRHICRDHGLRLYPIESVESIRQHLACRSPVIVMLGMKGRRVLSFDLPVGHWMVAYGYDRDHIYLTNWGRMTWDEFQDAWRRFVPRLIGMRMRGLVAVSPSVEL